MTKYSLGLTKLFLDTLAGTPNRLIALNSIINVYNTWFSYIRVNSIYAGVIPGTIPPLPDPLSGNYLLSVSSTLLNLPMLLASSVDFTTWVTYISSTLKLTLIQGTPSLTVNAGTLSTLVFAINQLDLKNSVELLESDINYKNQMIYYMNKCGYTDNKYLQLFSVYNKISELLDLAIILTVPIPAIGTTINGTGPITFSNLIYDENTVPTIEL